jgi:hypothetical protein
MTTLGTQNLWTLLKGGCCSEVTLCYNDFYLDYKMAVVHILGRWSLFKVVVSSGLTVFVPLFWTANLEFADKESILIVNLLSWAIYVHLNTQIRKNEGCFYCFRESLVKKSNVDLCSEVLQTFIISAPRHVFFYHFLVRVPYNLRPPSSKGLAIT